MRSAKAASLFAALGDETRLELVSRLAAGGPASITRLGTGLEVSRQAVKKHLDVLAASGLVLGRRHGREHVWAIVPGRLDDARAHLDAIGRQWEDALGRLARFVEDPPTEA